MPTTTSTTTTINPSFCCGPHRIAVQFQEGQVAEDCENGNMCNVNSSTVPVVCSQSGIGYCCCPECSDFSDDCGAGQMCCFGICMPRNDMGC